MINWVKQKIKQSQCNHNNTKEWLAPTVLRNGKLATLVIKECKDCLLVSSHTEAFEYGKENRSASASRRNRN